LQIFSFLKKLNIPYSKILYIGSAVVSLKFFLIIVPYILTKEEYFSFNQIYYTSGILIVFGRLGFDIIINKFDVGLFKLSLLVTANIFIGFLFVLMFDWNIRNPFEIIALFIYSFFYVLANIFLFKGLFQNNFKRYSIEKIAFGALLLLLLVLFHFIELNIIYVLPFSAFLWFFICRKSNSDAQQIDPVSFYKKGVSAFLINTLPGIPIIIDKFIAVNYFDVETANSYAFAWIVVSPLLYLGTIFEHIIYSSSQNLSATKVKRGVFISLLINFFIISSIILFLNYFSFLIPSSINGQLFLRITLIISMGYTIITSVQNPLKAYILKYSSQKTNSILTRIYPFVIILFLLSLYIAFEILDSSDFLTLLFIHFSFMTVIIFSQIYFINKIDKFSLLKTN